MNKITIALSVFAVSASFMAASAASAAIITFDSLMGTNGDVFTSTSESGFDVVATSGDWFEAHVNGNDVPSIFGDSDEGIVTVTRTDGGTFTLESVEFDDAGFSANLPWEITGLLNGSAFFSANGNATERFERYDNPFADSIFDTLVFTLDGTGTTSYNIDNINVSAVSAAVPLPASLGLMLFGIAGLGLARRRTT